MMGSGIIEAVANTVFGIVSVVFILGAVGTLWFWLSMESGPYGACFAAMCISGAVGIVVGLADILYLVLSAVVESWRDVIDGR